MDRLERARRDLVIANRVLAMHGVVDAYGHVSVRHPDNPERYLLSRSLSPELVGLDDIIEFRLDGTAVNDERPPYLERFIHGGIYEARPEVDTVVHAHAEATLPFGLVDIPLRPVIHSASEIGWTVPVWDIADTFGDRTNLLVKNMAQARDMAARLADNSVVLMRGHGFSAAGTSIIKVVTMCVYLPRNARILLETMRYGQPKSLSQGEIETRMTETDWTSPAARRGWNYWAMKAGCADLI